MADLEFDVAKRRTEPITFTLGDDHVYSFIPPKSAIMMMPILSPESSLLSNDEQKLELTKATFDWLGKGLSDEDNALLLARLRDPEDDLDADLLGEVVGKLSEKVAARPTT